MNKYFHFIVFLMGTFLLASCGEADTDGIILGIQDDNIILAQNLSMDEYENIKHKSALDIQNEDVKGNTNLDLIDLTYDNTKELNEGDEVEVWIKGDVFDSYPAQADAKKISQKN